MNTQDALLFLSYLNFDYNVIEKLINYFSMDNLSEIFKIKEDSLYNLNLLTKKSFEKFIDVKKRFDANLYSCLLYTSPSPRDRTRSRMPSSA